jgi:hypothetical protein
MSNDYIDFLFGLAGQLEEEGEKLVNALNASTGHTPENPNPLTKKMSRLIKEMRDERENEE